MWHSIKCLFLPVLAVLLPVVKANEAYIQVGLNFHNELRAKHGVPPLQIDAELNKLAMKCAQHYAKKKQMDHSCPHKRSRQFPPGYSKDGNLGENLGNFAGNMKITNDDAMKRTTKMWYDEIRMWDFQKSDAKPKHKLFDCLHFTQVVWKSTQKLGLAVIQMPEGGITRVWIVALYGPNGNVMGQFPENVPPPK